MDNRKIECFLTLAQQLNFSKAAEILNTTQPTLSRSIMAMEEEMGICLFDRTTNKMRLTPAGEYLVEGLRNMQDHYTAALNHARSLQDGFSGQIKIGITKGQSLFKAKRILQDYQELHPDIKFELLSDNLSSLRYMLDNHSLDFAIGYLSDYDFIARFSHKVICKTPMKLVVSKDHRFAGRNDGSLHLSDFRDETFLFVPKSETQSFRHLIQDCANAGFWPKTAEVPDLLSTILWIEAGYGVAALTEASISYGNPEFEYISLPELEAPELAFLWVNDNDSATNRAFIEYLQNIPLE